jgi:hypothetical protein
MDVNYNKKKVPNKEKAGFFMDMNDSSLLITNQITLNNNVFKVYHKISEA